MFSDWMTPPYIRPASDIPSTNTSSTDMDNSHHNLCVPTHTYNCEPSPNHGPYDDMALSQSLQDTVQPVASCDDMAPSQSL
jgi:hypothetical protein